MVNKLKKWWRKKTPLNKKLIIGAITLSILILIIFGAKIYLFINFLLGNDTLIDLTTDSQKIMLLGGESKEIKFNAKITANPFCEALCNYEFQDISNNLSLDKNSFILKGGAPFSREYTVKARTLEIGQQVYRFNIECKSKSTLLCSTKEQTVMRNLVVTLDYSLNEEEKKYVESIRGNLKNFSYKVNFLGKEADYFNESLQKIQEKVIVNISSGLIEFLKNDSLNKQSKIEELNRLWENQDYVSINKEIENFSESISYTERLSNQLNESIISNILAYNNLIDLLNQTNSRLNEIRLYHINESLTFEINSIIKDYNDEIAIFKTVSQLNDREKSVGNIYNNTNNFYDKIKNFNRGVNSAIITISEMNIDKITINRTINKYPQLFGEQPGKCCIFNKCYKCCTTNECRNNESNYPIVFLHGHQFNRDLPLEFNLDGFDKIQTKLESDNYLNLGVMSSYDEGKIDSWGRIPVPFTIKLSYYYDTLKQSGNYIIVQKKSEPIDVYAIRLNELVNELVESTGRPKVTIVSHSMGGLITRRYIQLFGTDKVDKIILIGTPNKGIEGSIADYCSVLGEQLECNDMKSDSLFINKLNRGNSPDIPVYMIIGSGCKTDGQDSDGIVFEKNAVLEGADNFFVNGICSGIDFLHVEMLDIDKYPEVYQIIENALNATG